MQWQYEILWHSLHRTSCNGIRSISTASGADGMQKVAGNQEMVAKQVLAQAVLYYVGGGGGGAEGGA